MLFDESGTVTTASLWLAVATMKMDREQIKAIKGIEMKLRANRENDAHRLSLYLKYFGFYYKRFSEHLHRFPDIKDTTEVLLPAFLSKTVSQKSHVKSSCGPSDPSIDPNGIIVQYVTKLGYKAAKYSIICRDSLMETEFMSLWIFLSDVMPNGLDCLFYIAVTFSDAAMRNELLWKRFEYLVNKSIPSKFTDEGQDWKRHWGAKSSLFVVIMLSNLLDYYEANQTPEEHGRKLLVKLIDWMSHLYKITDYELYQVFCKIIGGLKCNRNCEITRIPSVLHLQSLFSNFIGATKQDCATDGPDCRYGKFRNSSFRVNDFFLSIGIDTLWNFALFLEADWRIYMNIKEPPDNPANICNDFSKFRLSNDPYVKIGQEVRVTDENNDENFMDIDESSVENEWLSPDTSIAGTKDRNCRNRTAQNIETMNIGSRIPTEKVPFEMLLKEVKGQSYNLYQGTVDRKESQHRELDESVEKRNQPESEIVPMFKFLGNRPTDSDIWNTTQCSCVDKDVNENPFLAKVQPEISTAPFSVIYCEPQKYITPTSPDKDDLGDATSTMEENVEKKKLEYTYQQDTLEKHFVRPSIVPMKKNQRKMLPDKGKPPFKAAAAAYGNIDRLCCVQLSGQLAAATRPIITKVWALNPYSNDNSLYNLSYMNSNLCYFPQDANSRLEALCSSDNFPLSLGPIQNKYGPKFGVYEYHDRNRSLNSKLHLPYSIQKYSENKTFTLKGEELDEADRTLCLGPLLGRGGFAKVYTGRLKRRNEGLMEFDGLGRFVAAKIQSKELGMCIRELYIAKTFLIRRYILATQTEKYNPQVSYQSLINPFRLSSANASGSETRNMLDSLTHGAECNESAMDSLQNIQSYMNGSGITPLSSRLTEIRGYGGVWLMPYELHFSHEKFRETKFLFRRIGIDLLSRMSAETPPTTNDSLLKWQMDKFTLENCEDSEGDVTKEKSDIPEGVAILLIPTYPSILRLNDYINKKRNEGTPYCINENLVLFLTYQLLDMVIQLHTVDLLHGDIKIDNLVIFKVSEHMELLQKAEKLNCSKNNEGNASFVSSGRRNSIVVDGSIVELPSTKVSESGGGNIISAFCDFNNAPHPLLEHQNKLPFNLAGIDMGRSLDLAMHKEQLFQGKEQFDTYGCSELFQDNLWCHHIDVFGVADVAHAMLFGEYMKISTARDMNRVDGYHRNGAINVALRDAKEIYNTERGDRKENEDIFKNFNLDCTAGYYRTIKVPTEDEEIMDATHDKSSETQNDKHHASRTTFRRYRIDRCTMKRSWKKAFWTEFFDDMINLVPNAILSTYLQLPTNINLKDVVSAKKGRGAADLAILLGVPSANARDTSCLSNDFQDASSARAGQCVDARAAQWIVRRETLLLLSNKMAEIERIFNDEPHRKRTLYEELSGLERYIITNRV